MASRNPSSGSTTVAALLAIILLIITFATVYYFLDRPWFPEAISQDARDIDAQFYRTLWITGIVFVLSQVALAWVVFRYRAREHGQKARYSHGNNTMEYLWTGATLVLFVGLGIYARGAWAEMYFRGAKPGALQIEVTAQQFAWNFRYPGPDGTFGKVDPKFISDSGGNPVGLDPADPAGKDDIVVPVITVPVNREIELIMRSKDVTHAFWVRELRFKQDLVPGLVIRSHFTAEKIGQYDLACAELCGLGHHTMKSMLTVMSQEEYEKWLREQAVVPE